MKKLLTSLFYLGIAGFLSFLPIQASNKVPEPKREFRGSWIQCVNGQFNGLSPEAMRARLTQHLDALQKVHCNAVMFQIRAEGDALYPSRLEPWSRYLTGQQGRAPEPYWDPLQWMVEQCHKRGMEIHAWINPYRAKTAGTKELAVTHPYMLHPERFMHYGELILFNPGIPANRHWICKVAADIVSRYDVDGLHMDDYFYPYPNAGEAIPDAETFQADSRGFKNISDWRRDNVDLLIKELHDTLRQIKPWVKFGVSPFGIYHNARSGDTSVAGSNTRGLQNYDDLYADVLKWVKQGWVDYNMPQLYWEIGHPTADYETLIRWWSSQAPERPLIIGQDVDRTVKFADVKDASVNQLPAKMTLARTLPHIDGNCFWYSAAIAENHGSYATALGQMYQTHPALQPLMPFIDDSTPRKVSGLKDIWTPDGLMLVWLEPKAKSEMDRAYRYVVYRFGPGEGKDINDASHILTITDQTFLKLPYEDGKTKYTYVVTVLNRLSAESKAKSRKVKL
jgi:uncharacterized lipoprotein YddW (UPF0748 family)